MGASIWGNNQHSARNSQHMGASIWEPVYGSVYMGASIWELPYMRQQSTPPLGLRIENALNNALVTHW